MTKHIATIALLTAATWNGHAMAADEAQIARGKQVFNKWCVACHGAGERISGTASLAVKYGGNPPAMLEERTDLTPDFIRIFVRNGVMIMPAFRKTEVTDADLKSLSDYLIAPKK